MRIAHISKRVVAQTNGTAIFQKYLLVIGQYIITQVTISKAMSIRISMLDSIEAFEVHSKVTLLLGQP